MSETPIFLYVEDDPVSRKVLEIILKRQMGYGKLFLFEDTGNFIQRLEALPEKPDVILLDIHLSPYDGFQALEMLRKHPAYQNAVVIALTASVMNEEVYRLQEAGFDGAIAKPIDQVILPKLLKKILSGEDVWHIL